MDEEEDLMKRFVLKVFLAMLLLVSFGLTEVYATSSDGQYESFKEDVTLTDDPLKEWTIIMSKSIDAKTVTPESVYVLDEQGQSVPLKEIKVDGKKIIVVAGAPYVIEHTYTLYLNGTIQSQNGAKLKPTKFKFAITKPQPKIYLTTDLYAQVKNPDFQQFSLDLFVNGQVVGGYETASGETVAGRTIGVSTDSSSIVPIVEGQKRYYFLYDNTTNKLRAVYWELLSAMNVFEEWNQSTTFERSVAASELYVLLTNEFRAKEGKPLVAYDERLAKAAFEHSKDMGVNNYFSHTSFDGRSLGDRVWALCSSCTAIGENIAANQMNVFLAHHGWINSPGHRSNMLNDRYTHIGFGLYYSATASYNRFYTTNFGQIR